MKSQRLVVLCSLAILVLLTQGCSLLFVSKGRTSITSIKAEEVPEASSQSGKMSRAYVLHYKVEEGDSLEFIAITYFGRASAKKKLAKDNGLSPAAKLKPGKVLKIIDPLNIPRLDEVKKSREQYFSKDVVATTTPGKQRNESAQAFSNADTGEDEKDVAKIPRPKVNGSFAPGEKLTYEVKALGVVAGYATLSVGQYEKVESRPCYPLIAKAKAAFPFSTFYPVNDVQTSYFDTVDFITWKFENVVHEGNYYAHNQERYDQIKHSLVHQHNAEAVEKIDVQPFTQDIISCFYYFRLLPLEVGKKYLIPTCSGGKNYKLIVKVFSREKVTVPSGTFDCFRTKPFVKYGTVFRNNEDIDLWITADSRHIPVKIKSGIVIGSIEVSLLDAVVPDINGDGGKLISRLSQ